MSSQRIPNRKTPAGRLIPANQGRSRLVLALWMTVAMIVVVALGASAKDALLKGQVTVDQTKHEWKANAKAASDRLEARQHGNMLPGTDPMQIIMNGYVPPGMSPQQAAIIYNGLPNNLKAAPHMPQTGSPEWVARMAGEPADPLAGLPQGLSRGDVEAANQKMFEGYMRERFGPVYVPALHRDHNQASNAKTTPVAASHIKRDNQMSLIPAQFVYEGGSAPKSIREMTDSSGVVQSQYGYSPWGQVSKLSGTGPDSDMQYAGMYVHQRSGLNLTPHRAYSPSLGRWLSRDPIHSKTFRMMPKSPEPQDPRPGTIAHTDSALIAVLPVVRSMTSRPLELNPYAYVANDPVRWSDPNGTAIKLPSFCDLFPWFPGCKPKVCPVDGAPGGTDNGPDCRAWCYETYTGADQGKELSDCLARCKEFFMD